MIGDEQIGAQIVETIGRSPAVLLKNHGVFTSARPRRPRSRRR